MEGPFGGAPGLSAFAYFSSTVTSPTWSVALWVGQLLYMMLLSSSTAWGTAKPCQNSASAFVNKTSDHVSLCRLSMHYPKLGLAEARLLTNRALGYVPALSSLFRG